MTIPYSVIQEIKASLYRGNTQALVASRFGISQATVSKILHGRTGASVPWPDGTVGAGDLEVIRRAKFETAQSAMPRAGE